MDISINELDDLEGFLQQIKKQDRDDEKYILHNKMIPVSIGLFFIIVIMLFTPFKTALLSIGTLLIFSGLFFTLLLLLKDYRSISKESYDLSLLSYLKQKEERLKSWNATPIKYQVTFFIFIAGLVMMIVGNTGLMREFRTEYIVLSIAIYLVLLFISWIVGEYYYRKRYKKKHLPLLKNISEQINELVDQQNNTHVP